MSDDTKASTKTRGRIEEIRSMETKVRRPFRRATPANAANRAERSGNLLVEQMEATIAGTALNLAMGGTKEIAWSADVDPSNARRWVRGEAQNPVNRTRQIVQRAKQPFALVGFFAAHAVKALLEKDPMPEWRWRSLYLQALRDEAHPDGHEDVVTAELLTGKATIQKQYEADATHVAALLKRMALGMIGVIRGYSLNGPRGL